MNKKRVIDSISLSVTLLLFCIVLLTVKDNTGPIPVIFFHILAVITFIFFIFSTASMFIPSFIEWYEKNIINPPNKGLDKIIWLVFCTILVMAIFIGLVIGVYSLSILLPEGLSETSIIVTIVWIILVCICFITILRNKKGEDLDEKPESGFSNNVDITKIKMPSIDIVLDETRRKLDFQFNQIDGFSTKNGVVLGVAGVIFTILLTYIINLEKATPDLVIAKIALIPIFLSIILSFITIYIKDWETPPKLLRLRNYYINKNPDETKLNIIDCCIKSIKKNEVYINKIALLIQSSYILLFSGLILLCIWIFKVVCTTI
jgi:hypothetical protein